MQVIDYILSGVVFLSSLLGFFRGLTKELLGLLSWGGAGILTYFLCPFCKSFARQYVASEALADGLTGLAMFVFLLATFSFLSHLLSSIVQKSALSSIDRSLGFGFGVMRGCVMLFITEIVISCIYARPDYPDFFKNSYFYNFIIQGSDTVSKMTPASLKSLITMQRHKTTDKINATIQEKITESSKEVLKKTVEDLAVLKTKKDTTSTASQSKKTQDSELERVFEHMQ